jgi:hypothetical protein
MTTRLSIFRELPKIGWGDLEFPDQKPVNWYLHVAFLRRMWELGQDTILETAFYEPFEKPIRNSLQAIDLNFQSQICEAKNPFARKRLEIEWISGNVSEPTVVM